MMAGMGEVAQLVGQAQEVIEVGGEQVTLRPLRLNDLIEYEREVGDAAVMAGTMTGLRYEFYLAAKRGGSGKTLEEIGELIGMNDTARIAAALRKLVPRRAPSLRRLAEMLREVNPELDQAAAQTTLELLSSLSDSVREALAAIAPEEGDAGNAMEPAGDAGPGPQPSGG